MPLADRIRPTSLDDMVGQAHLIGENGVLRRIAESGQLPNMIFCGPPGCGKTTLATILAGSSGKRLCCLNGTTASTKDVKDILDEVGTFSAPNGILLYLDEIQYFTRKQQQTLLQFIENGSVTLIASTADNPYFYVYPAILSRSAVFEFRPVEAKEIEKALRRAFVLLGEERGEPFSVSEEVITYLASSCGGDVRKALGAAELCALTAPRTPEGLCVSLETAGQVTGKSAVTYDRDGDRHYDILSAFQKSVRGSDPDAALHYLALLLRAGDLPSVCRRLLVMAAEDIGLAYPQAISVCKACTDAALQLGLPEARIPLAEAAVLLATAPKSDSAIAAIDAALADVDKGMGGDIPAALKDAHYKGAAALGHGTQYRYPHAYPHHWCPQDYLPEDLRGRHYYAFGDNKTEQAAKAYWDIVKQNTP